MAAESLNPSASGSTAHGRGALPQQLQLHVVSAAGELLAGAAYYVSVPGEAGRIGILPGHEPVLAVLRPGAVQIVWQQGAKPQTVSIRGGVIEAGAGHVIIMADLLDRSPAAQQRREQDLRQRSGQTAVPMPLRAHDYAGLKAELDAELVRFFQSVLHQL